MADSHDELLKKFSEKRNEWTLDIILFAREFLGIGLCNCDSGKPCEIDHIQENILREFSYLIRTKLYMQKGLVVPAELLQYIPKIGVSIQSGKGVGKTFLASIAGIWFLTCFHNSRVIVMGPKYEQIKASLWSEITKWLGHAQKVFGANCLANVIYEKLGDSIYMKQVSKVQQKNQWVMRIKTFPKNTSVEEQQASVQGEHEKNMLFLMDECSGIPDYIFEPVEATLTEKNNTCFAIFNPNKNTGWAIETQNKMKEKWVTMHINSENSPRVTKEQISYMEMKYGRDSNKFRVSILGLPPLQENGCLIPWNWIQEAKDRYDGYMPDDSDPMIHGNDIGAGGDKSVCCRRKGYKVIGFEENSTSDTHISGNWLQRLAMQDMPDVIFGDSNGIGNKTHADLRALRIWKVVLVNTNCRATDLKFFQLRDQLLWRLRTMFEDGLISIPDDEELEGELSLLTYDDDYSNGKIKITSKKDPAFKREMLSRLGYKSPNKVDSLALTCYYDADILKEQKARIKGKLSDNTTNRRDDHEDKRFAWMTY